MSRHKRSLLSASLFLVATTLIPGAARAFCGFYVAGADSSLYNDATMVVMMRAGTRTALSMQNSYAGPPEDFAMVVPVPTVLKESDIRVVQQTVFDKLDAYTAPRLAEYYDPNPCGVYTMYDSAMPNRALSKMGVAADDFEEEAKEMGVTIEAQYTVGEYDILILSAEESSGLKKWLTQNSFK